MTGSERKKLMTIGQMISKSKQNWCFKYFFHNSIQTFTSALQGAQPAVESWNQMPQWDEKALTGRNVDDLVLSYLVWSHLALPYAHGMKNKQERRENSQKPGTVSAAAAGADAVCSALLCGHLHIWAQRKASMTKHRDHFASRQNIKLKACRIDGCFLRQQERVSPCQVDRGRCRIFFVPKGKKPSAEKQEKEKKEVDGGKQRDEGEGQGLEKEDNVVQLHLPGQLLVAPPADEHIVQQRNNRNEDLQTVTTSALELA
ncbi:hypothetical protein T4E_4204 [Trichinella pseudospiralis]|uniref:Uncharacterized protein n=1 Tax=Trichinella pseudospiralis TaxID=6337 RepID=A0A0V0YAB0_TRIPS|nr:hypothetical protein T4E_4204 [Trichinella pseudospiralis]